MLHEKLKSTEEISDESYDELVVAAGASQESFDEVFDLLYDPDFKVRSRCAKILLRVSAQNPQLAQNRKAELFKQLPRMQAPDVKVQMTRLLPFLKYELREQKFISDLLLHWLKAEVKSEEVKLACMNALALMAANDPFLKPEVIIEIEQQMYNGSTEIRNLGQKLLQKIKK